MGPTGSGKSTLLSSLDFVHAIARDGLMKAVRAAGGLVGLRHLDAAASDMIEFEITRAGATWCLTIPFNGPNPDAAMGETFQAGDAAIINFAPLAAMGIFLDTSRSRNGGDHPFFSMLTAAAATVGGNRLIESIVRYTHRRALAYDIDYLRRSGSQVDSETELSTDGRSVWSTMRNWRDRRETRARFDFVVASMRDAFPGQFEDLEFEFTAQQVSGRVFVPGRKEPMAHHLFSDGWFTGLLHLSAVASAPPGSILSIDEIENSLHPHAIRSILRSMQRWSDEQRLAIVIATHSPVVLNEINERDRILVTEHVGDRFPVRLDEHPNSDWLAHFSVGDDRDCAPLTARFGAKDGVLRNI